MSGQAETVEYDETGGQTRAKDGVPDLLSTKHHKGSVLVQVPIALSVPAAED